VKRDDLIPLGTIVRTHGYDGTVVIKTGRSYGEETEEMESVFVEVDGIPVPFILTGCEASQQSLFVSFSGYDSRQAVAEFTGCRVFVEGVPKGEEDTQVPYHLIGYHLTEPSGEKVGIIKAVESYPMQVMLILLDPGGHEVLIPLNPDWIVRIDMTEEKIVMDLPEGLLSANL
jgi:16S rRNA processing protein RimM